MDVECGGNASAFQSGGGAQAVVGLLRIDVVAEVVRIVERPHMPEPLRMMQQKDKAHVRHRRGGSLGEGFNGEGNGPKPGGNAALADKSPSGA